MAILLNLVKFKPFANSNRDTGVGEHLMWWESALIYGQLKLMFQYDPLMRGMVSITADVLRIITGFNSPH